MHNVGKIDRIIRITIAAVLLILYFTDVFESGIILFFAFMLIITSLRRCCPLYAVVGLGTCGIKVDKTENKIETEKLNLKN